VSNRNLAELVRALYPEPHTLHLPDGTHGDGSGATVAEFLIVPHARRPRLAVPVRSRAERIAAVRHLATPRAFGPRLKQAAVRAVVATPGTGRIAFRDRLRVSGPPGADSLQTYLSEALGTDVSLCLHVGGGLRANRKPVAEVLDARGGTIGFAKVGVNDLTRALVRNEAAALRRLGEAGLRHSTVPEVRHAGRWRDFDVLVQSALPVWQRPAAVTAEAVTAAMGEVARVAGVTRGALDDGDYADRLTIRLDEVADDAGAVDRAVRSELRTAGFRALKAYGGIRLDFGAWHGDWSPWNMHPAGTTIYVWDWERFEVGVPVGFDGLHHAFNAALGRGVAPRRAAEQLVADAPAVLGGFGVAPAEADATVAAYLVDIAARYLADRQDESGQALGAVADWMLPVLHQHLTR